MKTFVRFLCFAIVMLSALAALAQNPNYSSYYSYTITYNEDGSATVTATAEVFGWDDADDWVIGGYRPLCSLHPKAQVTPDADWVSTVGRGLYQHIDYVHTGAPVQLPADGTEVAINFAVEVDVSCDRPNSYYLYPSLASLFSWSPISMEWFSLTGFSPFQTNPPSWITYCFSPEVCPVGTGQAYFYNFADYADFSVLLLFIHIDQCACSLSAQQNGNCTLPCYCIPGFNSEDISQSTDTLAQKCQRVGKTLSPGSCPLTVETTRLSVGTVDAFVSFDRVDACYTTSH